MLPKIQKEYEATLPVGYPAPTPYCICLQFAYRKYFGIRLRNSATPCKNHDLYVKDTADFLRRLQGVPCVAEEVLLVTLDVKSLYSNIPHSDGTKACEHLLNLNPECRGISTESVSDLVSTVLTKNHFQFNGDNYLQTMGCAMGTNIAPSFASLFMGKFEKDILSQYHQYPFVWLRFLDDIFLIWQYSEKELLDFIENSNNAHPSIKCTYHYSNENATFLDVDISRNSDCILDTSVHVKKTNNYQYIEYSSCHPVSCKTGIPFSQAKRYHYENMPIQIY